jgi:DNA-binding MarR family transcriptional regulator
VITDVLTPTAVNWRPHIDRETPTEPLTAGGDAVSDPDFETVVELLADPCVRTLLAATARRPHSAAELADAADVSRQTAYRRLDVLEAAGLVSESTRPRADGHHETVYEAELSSFSVELTEAGFSFAAEFESAEADAADELTKLWEHFHS